jgi:oxygen-independent coproporphyrinogen-3 oxidase
MPDAGTVRLDATRPHASRRSDPEPDGTGLYVHVPFCRSKCRYCGFYSVPVAGRHTGRLVDCLLRELDQYDGIEFTTGYIGGGSPTALPAGQLIGLACQVAQRLVSGAEFTVECNPGQVEPGLLEGLRQAGVNRLSFGAQSFHPAELELLGRGHRAEDIRSSVDLARRVGYDNLGLDLIFALPGSSLTDWQYSVAAALDLGVQHISAYSLSFEPGTVFDAWRRSGRLSAVEEDLDRAMYDWTIERLGQAGLRQYEISNFARVGCECRHNLGYWANQPYVGIGPGAASSAGILPVIGLGVPNAGFCVGEPRGMGVPAMTADTDHGQGAQGRDGRAPSCSWAGRPCHGQGARVTNNPEIESYVIAVENGAPIPREVQPVNAADTLCETAVLNLRRRAGIDLATFARQTGHDALRTFAGPIQRYRDLGLIEVTPGAVRLTAPALPIADSILCDFAALE